MNPASRGVVLLALLLVIALLGIGLMAAVDVWSLSMQRERERQLLFAGEQYRQAIRRYYLAAPAVGARSLPPSLAVLLDDDRFPIPVHHLRRAYPDPMTGSTDWGLVRVADQIIGVYSLGEGHPVKQTGFPGTDKGFDDATSYRDWVFLFQLPRRGPVPAAAPASGVPGVDNQTTISPTSPKRSPK
jgi:type II secretory pathway pseudopilin PulG